MKFYPIILAVALPALSASVTTNIPLPEEKNEYRVNTADSNNTILLENSTITQIGNSNLLLRLSTEDAQKINKKVPVLGNMLPFLFSKDMKNDRVSSIDIVCTPILQINDK